MVVDFGKINEQLDYWSYPLMRTDRIFSWTIQSKIIVWYMGLGPTWFPFFSVHNLQMLREKFIAYKEIINEWRLYLILDIRSGYCNITVAKESRKYTVFTTEYGKYEFLRLPFEMHVTPSYFHTDDQWESKRPRFLFNLFRWHYHLFKM